jgi:hypothetical protein
MDMMEKCQEAKELLTGLFREQLKMNPEITIDDWGDGPATFVDDWLVIYPFINEKTKRQEWEVYTVKHYPGSFNPITGGDPPDWAEKSVDIFKNLAGAVGTVATLYVANMIDGYLTNIEESKIYSQTILDDDVN